MALPSFVKIVNGQPTIDLGAMRHQVSVLQEGPSSPAVYDAGGIVQGWNPIATGIFAAIGSQAAGSVKGGMDVIKGDEITSQLYLAVAMWYMSGLLPNMRIKSDNGSTYVIQSVENVLEMNVVLVLTCLGIGVND